MKSITYSIIFFLTILTAQSQEMKLLSEEHYSISYPSDWQLDQSDQLTEFYLFSKLEGNGDSFNENINLISQNLSGVKIDLDEYTRITVNQIRHYFKDEVLKAVKRKNVDGENFTEVIYSGKMEDVKLRILQYNYLKDGKAYVLTFTAEEDKFDAYKDVVYKTFNSFRFTNVTSN